MSKDTNIVILGAGYSGVHAAKELGKHFKKDGTVHITLIDRNPYHTLMTELHEIAGSRTEPEAVQISLAKIFAGHKSKVVIDEIRDIDFTGKVLSSDTAKYHYDYLLLGTGGSPEFFGTPGIQQNAFTLWSLEDAIRIRESVELRFRDAAREPDPAKRAKLLTFAIAGAGFTGIELAGELLDRTEVLCPKYHILREEVRILIIEAKDSVLPILPESLRIKSANYLKKRGAEVLINAPITKSEEGKIFLANGTVIEAATFIWTCGIQGSEFTARINLTKGKTSNDKCSIASPEGIHGMAGCRFDEDEQYIVGERGRILVNEYMQSVDHKNVYLAGDMTWFVYEEKVIPQIVETALQTSQTAAHNIIADIQGKERKPFKPEYHGFMVSIGATYGVAHVMGISMSGFMAMATKHLINLHYLWEVAGFNACWGYIKEEFTQVKDRRSIARGHLSAKVPAYWLLPARLWLGLMWVIESVNKIGEGWLLGDKSRSSWMFSPGVTQGGAVAASTDASATAISEVLIEGGEAVMTGTDGVAAASEAWVEEGAAVVSDAVIEGGEAVMTAVDGATESARALGKFWNLDSPILTPDSWIVTTFRSIFMDSFMAILPFQIFQIMIVLTELAIGLMLMGGFLTWGAALASIGMCFIFTLSGMFSWSQLWFIFLAITMLGGAGHVAGLDHWVMPGLKKWWSGTKLAHSTYLYDGEPRVKKGKK